MLTIPEIDEIAKRATERIAKDFAESGFANPPVVTHGIARAVLEAAQQSVQSDLLNCGHTKSASWDGRRGVCVACEVTASR